MVKNKMYPRLTLSVDHDGAHDSLVERQSLQDLIQLCSLKNTFLKGL
jgi:hypothetical protein